MNNETTGTGQQFKINFYKTKVTTKYAKHELLVEGWFCVSFVSAFESRRLSKKVLHNSCLIHTLRTIPCSSETDRTTETDLGVQGRCAYKM